MIDAQFKHPFTCIIAGPTGCGKSTFVSNLLTSPNNLIDAKFDYLYIFIGTEEKQNETLSQLKQKIPNTSIIEIKQFRKKDDNSVFSIDEFSKYFKNLIEKQKHKKGCIIFDDLMSELTQNDMLLNLFTRYSRHASITVIHITQNLFFKGKRSSDHVTIFRNTKVLVLFDTPMDNSIFTTVAKRMGEPTQQLIEMLKDIVQKYRYVVIRGDFNTPPELKYTSDIFAQKPFPHQKAFTLFPSST